MRIDIVTLFPELVESVIQFGVVGRAVDTGLLQVECINPRNFADNTARTVDDRPYGGGPGMVLRYGPLLGALQSARDKAMSGVRPKVIYLSPQGRLLDRNGVQYLAGLSHIILLCGRYEGIDERFVDAHVDEEWSIGDYVLSGGEMAAMVVIDAIGRRLPGALGHCESVQQDSFENGLLDCPHYTRPESVDGMQVPEVLTSGHHEQIERWRLKQSLGRTYERRPDLLKAHELTDEERTLLNEYIKEKSKVR